MISWDNHDDRQCQHVIANKVSFVHYPHYLSYLRCKRTCPNLPKYWCYRKNKITVIIIINLNRHVVSVNAPIYHIMKSVNYIFALTTTEWFILIKCILWPWKFGQDLHNLTRSAVSTKCKINRPILSKDMSLTRSYERRDEPSRILLLHNIILLKSNFW